jgi:hypothetical protein
MGLFENFSSKKKRFKNWKLIRGCPGEEQNDSKSKYKQQTQATQHPNQTNYYLFDILNDPLEDYNLADTNPDLVQLLVVELEKIKKNTVMPLNPPDLRPDPKSNPKYFGDTWSPGWC